MNEQEKMWRFPGNNYTQDQGIDTPDMETFAQDPIASLARETCQNSIDAKLENKTAKIEFHTFDIKKKDIPGIERLEREIDSCMEYRRSNPKLYDTLSKMREQLDSSLIHCIRVSDFNTTGLRGVMEMDNSPFFLLTKGTGISDKSGSKGGSKGIGKFASFVASSFNTVFYSTLNEQGEEGYIGICKLCSTRMDNTDEKTVGIGYYGSDKKNMPIASTLVLDNDFHRTETGTDIYILGFRKSNYWKRDLVTKILDSFMVAIYNNDLEVQVDDLCISKDTLKDVVYNEEFINKRSVSNIRSQFMLLDDEDVFRDDIDLDGYGTVKILLKSFSKEQANLATHECVMIRFPFMKIKVLRNISNVPCSAMCIIGDNALNTKLRDIENPQHTNWDVKRYDDDDDVKRELSNIIKLLNSSIIDYVSQKLLSVDTKETDVEGASDLLPEVSDSSNIGTGENEIVVEKAVISKKVKNKVKSKNGVMDDEDSLALVPDIASHTLDGEGSPIPEGHNNGGGGSNHDSDNETGLSYDSGENDAEVLKSVPLSGMRYVPIIGNKSNGEYIIKFKSLYTENNCDLEIYYLDDANSRYKVSLNDCTINGVPVSLDNNSIKGIKIEENKVYEVKISSNLREMYALEVKMYANRK